MNKPRTNNRNSKYNSKEGSHSRTGGMDRKNFKNDRFPRKEGERLERTHRTASTSPQTKGKIAKKDVVKFDITKIKLKGRNILCSFVVLQGSNFDSTMDTLQDIASEDIANIVISIPTDSFSNTVQYIEENLQDVKEKFTFASYTIKTSEFQIHNNAFKVASQRNESDMLFATNSSMMPRQYSIEILRKYLSRENSVVVIPTVYNQALEIQKYCLRFPSVVAKLKCLLGCKKTTAKLCMMERGNAGYYKIHRTDISLSQSLFVNSAIFKTIGMFPKCRDSHSALYSFYKKLSKHGTALFVPTARFIELEPRQAKRCIFSRVCYFLKNVF
jgi:hypothetical protein